MGQHVPPPPVLAEPLCSSASPDLYCSSFFVVTAGFSDLMAVFDESWRLRQWTRRVREATVFDTQAEALKVIESAAGEHVAAAVRSGRLIREHDEDLGEDVFAAPEGGVVVVRPRLRVAELGPARWPRGEVRAFVRQEFRDAAARNSRRPSTSLRNYGEPRTPIVPVTITPQSKRALQGKPSRRERLLAQVPG